MAAPTFDSGTWRLPSDPRKYGDKNYMNKNTDTAPNKINTTGGRKLHRYFL
jgi:hypothetical protein